MGRINKEKLPQINQGVIEQYIISGDSKALSEEQKRQVDLLKEAYRLVDKHGMRQLAIREMQVLHDDITRYTARQYVDLAVNMFNSDSHVDRKLLEGWTIAKLTEIVNDQEVTPDVKVRALATMLKHLENMPAENVDPRLREQNNVGIVFNIGEVNSPKFTEEVLAGLTKAQREKLLSNIDGTITPEKAAEIMDVPFTPYEETPEPPEYIERFMPKKNEDENENENENEKEDRQMSLF